MALYPPAYKNAVAGQRDIMERLPNATDKDAAMLLKSFVALEMLKLRLKMKPAPKPIDVSKPKNTGIPSVE